MTVIEDKQPLIDKLNDAGYLEIDLGNGELIYISKCFDSRIEAERDIWSNAVEEWRCIESYGIFENIEDLFKMLEEEEVLTFKK